MGEFLQSLAPYPPLGETLWALLGRQESTLTVPPTGLLVVTITLRVRVPSEEGLLCLSFLLGPP